MEIQCAFQIQVNVHNDQTVRKRLHVHATIMRSGRKRLHVHATIMRSGRNTIFMLPTADILGLSDMATPLISLFSVPNFPFLPNHSVKYYDYIVKSYSGVACNWCVSLEIA